MRPLRSLLLACTAFLPLTAAPVRAQEEDVTEPVASAAVDRAPDAMALAQAAATRGDHAEALSRYLRILSDEPDNVAALAGAGTAALGVGDVNAATGFLARADALDPRNGPVKAGIAVTMIQNDNPRGALRLFREAVDLGVPVTSILADRGLAYDLRGDPRRAQADYQLALAARPDDEVTRRLALSQAISGDRTAALATLDPLLRRQDVPAWRTRAFVLALTGDPTAAAEGAGYVMPPDQVLALTPYLGRLGGLRNAQKAAAIHLGRFPGEGDDQKQAARTVSAPKLAVDTSALAAPPVVAAASPAPGPTPAELAARAQAEAAARAKEEARVAAAAKAKADALARARKEREEKAAAQAVARRNPARHFVQVAGGANEADLPKEWAKLKAKWPGQLGGQTPWRMAYRFTNRLLIGPFPSSSAAQAWVGARQKEGFATFRVSTRAGEVVERLN
ncbi:SPOR domain-containing protein [Sphingomonas sp.]|uniref:SPOR domain-containing protein n=1 Tax=Sphingomonas sp. TaxID=28214 RepID=UPI003B3BC0CE